MWDNGAGLILLFYIFLLYLKMFIFILFSIYFILNIVKIINRIFTQLHPIIHFLIMHFVKVR